MHKVGDKVLYVKDYFEEFFIERYGKTCFFPLWSKILKLNRNAHYKKIGTIVNITEKGYEVVFDYHIDKPRYYFIEKELIFDQDVIKVLYGQSTKD